MIKKYLMALVVTLLCVNSVGCETMPTSPTSLTPSTAQPEAVKYVANFDYTSSSQAVPLSGGVTFAIGSVVHGRDPNIPSWIAFEQFANLDKAIAQDLLELLTAKGFSVRGPFDSTDLIPYSDKKDIDFLLVPVMELFITLKDNKAEKVVSSLPPPPMFNFTGNAEVSGKMRLELREIVTNELMWAKSIPFTNTFPYNVSISGYINESQYYVEASRVPFKYGLIMDDVAKGMEKEYSNLMATVSKLIDPEEMRIIRKQAQELKSKKGY